MKILKKSHQEDNENTDCPFSISFKLVKHGQPSCIIDLEEGGVPGIPGLVKNSSGIREIGKIYSVYSVIREIKQLPGKIYSVLPGNWCHAFRYPGILDLSFREIWD